jgi:SNF2 family DNA or RNA helicase
MKQPLNEQFIRMQKLAGIITENQYKEMLLILEDESIDESLKNWLLSGLIALSTLTGVGKVYQIDQKNKEDRATQIEYYQKILTPEVEKMDSGDLEMIGLTINNKTKDLAQNFTNTPEENNQMYTNYAEKYMQSHPNEFAVGLNGGVYWTLAK